MVCASHDMLFPWCTDVIFVAWVLNVHAQQRQPKHAEFLHIQVREQSLSPNRLTSQAAAGILNAYNKAQLQDEELMRHVVGASLLLTYKGTLSVREMSMLLTAFAVRCRDFGCATAWIFQLFLNTSVCSMFVTFWTFDCVNLSVMYVTVLACRSMHLSVCSKHFWRVNAWFFRNIGNDTTVRTDVHKSLLMQRIIALRLQRGDASARDVPAMESIRCKTFASSHPNMRKLCTNARSWSCRQPCAMPSSRCHWCEQQTSVGCSCARFQTLSERYWLTRQWFDRKNFLCVREMLTIFKAFKVIGSWSCNYNTTFQRAPSEDAL